MPHHNYYKNESVDKHQTVSSQRERTQIIFLVLVAVTFTSTHDHDAVKRPIPDISNLNQRISLEPAIFLVCCKKLHKIQDYVQLLDQQNSGTLAQLTDSSRSGIGCVTVYL